MSTQSFGRSKTTLHTTRCSGERIGIDDSANGTVRRAAAGRVVERVVREEEVDRGLVPHHAAPGRRARPTRPPAGRRRRRRARARARRPRDSGRRGRTRSGRCRSWRAARRSTPTPARHRTRAVSRPVRGRSRGCARAATVQLTTRRAGVPRSTVGRRRAGIASARSSTSTSRRARSWSSAAGGGPSVGATASTTQPLAARGDERAQRAEGRVASTVLVGGDRRAARSRRAGPARPGSGLVAVAPPGSGHWVPRAEYIASSMSAGLAWCA